VSGALLYKFTKIIDECVPVVFTSYSRHLIMYLWLLFLQFLTQFTIREYSMRALGWLKSVGLITAASISALPFIFFSKVAQSQSSSVHMTMGNPSNAVTSTSYPTNYLLVKSQYALSYNNDKGTPNWVSWQLNNSWLGSTPRQDDFRADTTLPSTFKQIAGSDYTGSGFDRGHMTPSADRTNTVSSNSSTFLMTNILPQSPDNNQGPWASLENYLRTLVSQGKELYIIAGAYGSCGTGSNGSKCSIAAATDPSESITVPNRVWKVVVVVTPGSGAGGVTTNTRVIAVNMPNTQGIRSNSWQSYRTTVDSIEQQTGYNLLSSVASSTQTVIEARVDNQ
jgi:endonuclease G